MDQYIGKLLDNRYEILERLGSGGMATKLRAAKIAMDAGFDMIIMNGENPKLLYDLCDGKAVGTRFIGKKVAVV